MNLEELNKLGSYKLTLDFTGEYIKVIITSNEKNIVATGTSEDMEKELIKTIQDTIALSTELKGLQSTLASLKEEVKEKKESVKIKGKKANVLIEEVKVEEVEKVAQPDLFINTNTTKELIKEKVINTVTTKDIKLAPVEKKKETNSDLKSNIEFDKGNKVPDEEW